MPILRKDSTRKEDFKLIGVSVRRWVHEYLTLYTLAKGSTKSILLRQMVEQLLIEQREINTDAILIKEISDKLNYIRYEDRVRGVKLSFEKYKEEVLVELRKRGLKESYIEIIMSQLKDEED